MHRLQKQNKTKTNWKKSLNLGVDSDGKEKGGWDEHFFWVDDQGTLACRTPVRAGQEMGTVGLWFAQQTLA